MALFLNSIMYMKIDGKDILGVVVEGMLIRGKLTYQNKSFIYGEIDAMFFGTCKDPIIAPGLNLTAE